MSLLIACFFQHRAERFRLRTACDKGAPCFIHCASRCFGIRAKASHTERHRMGDVSIPFAPNIDGVIDIHPSDIPTRRKATQATSGRQAATGRRSDCLDLKRRDPHFALLKSRLQSFFECNEELPRLGRARRIDKDADHFIAKEHAAVFPLAANDLRFLGKSRQTARAIPSRFGRPTASRAACRR